MTCAFPFPRLLSRPLARPASRWAALGLCFAMATLCSCGASRNETLVAKRALKDTSFERSWDLPFDRAVIGHWLPTNAVEVPGAPAGTPLSQPNLLLIQLDSLELVAVDAYNGHTKWMTAPLPERIRLAPTITITYKSTGRAGITARDVRTYVIAQDVLYCFEGEGGQLVWRWDMPFAAASSPRAIGTDSDLRCMIGEWNNRVQVASVHPEKKFIFDLWQYNLLTPVTAEPVWANDRFFVGDHGGNVTCLAKDRNLAWSSEVGGEVRAPVAVRGDHVYVGTSDGTFVVLGRVHGERLAEDYLGGPIERQPMVFVDDPEVVFVWVGGSDPQVAGLYAYRVVADRLPARPGEKTGKEIARLARLWYLPGVATLVASSPEHLFVTSAADGQIVKAVSRQRGSEDWTWDAKLERQAEALEMGQAAPTAVDLLDYQDVQDQNRTFYVFDDLHQVVAYRFLGPVLPGAPEGTTGSIAPKVSEDAGKKPEDAADEAPAIKETPDLENPKE